MTTVVMVGRKVAEFRRFPVAAFASLLGGQWRPDFALFRPILGLLPGANAFTARLGLLNYTSWIDLDPRCRG